jgi:Phage tail lysozyme
MAVIRPIEARQGLDTGGMPGVRMDGSVVQGLAAIGGAISQAGQADAEMELRRARMVQENAEFGAEQSFLQFKQRLALTQSEIETQIAPSGEGYSGKVAEEYQKQSELWLQTVPANVRPRMSGLLETHRVGVLTGAAAKEADQRRTWFRTGVETRTNELAAQVVQVPEAFDASLADGLRMIEASGLPPAEKQTMADGLKKTLLLSKAENYKRTAPEKIIGARVGPASEKGAGIRDALVRDLGLSRVSAAAFAGNFHIETGGYKNLQEIAPMVRGSRGGYGIAQWTGPRRKAYEAWAAERGLDPASDDANYGFLVHELTKTGEGKVLEKLRNVTDPKEAALIVSREFLRPGIPHEGKRIAATMRYFDGSEGEGGVELSPEFAELPASDQLKLYDEASAAANQLDAQQAALAKAEYAAAKDSLELGIVTGKITSQQDILNANLTDGDKATLIRSLGTVSQSEADAQAFVQSLTAGDDVSVNPYDTDQRGVADKAFEKLASAAPPEAMASVERSFVEATGYLPKQVVSDLRLGAASEDAGQFAAAMQKADLLDRAAPQALSASEGGSDVRKALEQYRSRIDMGMDAAGAAKAVLKSRSPEMAVARDVLKPMADKFLKTVTPGEVLGAFDDGWFSSQPSAPVAPAQASALMSEYAMLAEEAFYETGGDAAAAKAIAKAKVRETWGATGVSGSKSLMKYPPEKFYPGRDGDHGYLRDDAMQSAKDVVADLFPGRTVSNVALVSDPAITRADIEAGRPPRYRLFYSYETADGVTLFDTLPGVMWGMDKVAAEAKAWAVDPMDTVRNSRFARFQPALVDPKTSFETERAQQQSNDAALLARQNRSIKPADVTPPKTVQGRIAEGIPGIDPGLVETLNVPVN